MRTHNNVLIVFVISYCNGRLNSRSLKMIHHKLREGRLIPKEKCEDTKRVIKRRSRKSKDRRCNCQAKKGQKDKWSVKQCTEN